MLMTPEDIATLAVAVVALKAEDYRSRSLASAKNWRALVLPGII